MGIGTSLFLIALGAILTFAVSASISGISLAAVGVILIVIGILGLVISLVWLMQAKRGVVAHSRIVQRHPDV
jgi:hypothetical protein